MAADASIYGQIQQPKPVNMLAEYADMARIQSAQQQNALNQFAMGEKVRGIERQNKLMEIAPQGANALRSAGFWKEALEMEEGQTKREKATIDAENARLGVRKTKDELIGSRAAFLRTNPTPENAAAFFDGLAQDNLMPADMAGQFKSLSVSNPDKIGAFADQLWRAAISAEKQMPKTQSTGAGGFTANLAVDPLTGVATETGRIQHTATPGDLLTDQRTRAEGAANRAVTMRGQDLVSERAKEANAVKAGAETTKKVSEAKDVLGLLDEVDALLPKATGSYIGAGIDQAARAIGKGTPGAEATAQLKTLQGALISKMPKMTGPQSDKDVQLYREMAGQVGDPTLPVSVRQAASKSIRALNEKYAGVAPGSSAAPTVVRTGTHNGRKVVQYSDGRVVYAD